MNKKNISEYRWINNREDNSYPYLSKTLLKILYRLNKKISLLDIGCGNGSLTKVLSRCFEKTFAIDKSKSAIFFAKKKNVEKINFKLGTITKYQKNFKLKNFDVITAIEVIEHIYSPKIFLKEIKKIMKKKTYLIISTPYHGYFKNLAISLFDKFDNHVNPLWEHGHIKFWSTNTLKKILNSNGFRVKKIYFSGRFYPFSKSMIFLVKLK